VISPMASTIENDTIVYNKPQSTEFTDTYENNVHVYHLAIGKGAGDKTIDTLLASFLGGYGNMQLLDITVSYVFLSSKAIFKCGTKSALSKATIDHIALKENGIYAVSSDFQVGKHVTIHIVPQHGVSKQIRPTSSTHPMMNFVWSATDNVEGLVSFKLQSNGPEEIYGSLN